MATNREAIGEVSRGHSRGYVNPEGPNRRVMVDTGASIIMVVQKLLTEWIIDRCGEDGRNPSKSSEVHQVMAAVKEDQPACNPLLKQVLHKTNLWKAWEQVKENRGAPGIDRVTIGEFAKELSENLGACPRIIPRIIS